MIVLVVAQLAVLAVLCVLVAGLLRSYATVLRRLHALDGGEAAEGPAPFRTIQDIPSPVRRSSDDGAEWAPAADLEGETLIGELAQVRTVGVEHDTVLAFLSSNCAGCEGFWDELQRPGTFSMPASGRLVVVTKDGTEESPSLLRQLAPAGLDVVMSSRALADYGVPGSPYVVVVDGRSGRVKGEGTGTSFSQVAALVAQAVGDADLPASRRSAADQERDGDVDRVLRAAGIGPGHPSLHGAALEPSAPYEPAIATAGHAR